MLTVMAGSQTSPTYTEIFALVLTELRTSRNWTQEELRDRSRVAQSTISSIENADEERRVRGVHVEMLLKAFEISAPQLIAKMSDMATRMLEGRTGDRDAIRRRVKKTAGGLEPALRHGRGEVGAVTAENQKLIERQLATKRAAALPPGQLQPQLPEAAAHSGSSRKRKHH